MNKPAYFVFVVAMLLLFIGCGSRKTVVKKYYVIDLPRAEESILSDSLPSIDKYCEIITVNVYPAYATRQIPIRSQSHEIEYFTYHEWAVRPQEILTRLMEEFLRQHGVFKEASVRFWKNVPELQIETTVFNLEIFEEKGKFFAHLNIEFRLMDNESGEIIIKHSENTFKELDKKDMNLFASAVSELYRQEMRKFCMKAMVLHHNMELSW